MSNSSKEKTVAMVGQVYLSENGLRWELVQIKPTIRQAVILIRATGLRNYIGLDAEGCVTQSWLTLVQESPHANAINMSAKDLNRLDKCIADGNGIRKTAIAVSAALQQQPKAEAGQVWKCGLETAKYVAVSLSNVAPYTCYLAFDGSSVPTRLVRLEDGRLPSPWHLVSAAPKQAVEGDPSDGWKGNVSREVWRFMREQLHKAGVPDALPGWIPNEGRVVFDVPLGAAACAELALRLQYETPVSLCVEVNSTLKSPAPEGDQRCQECDRVEVFAGKDGPVQVSGICRKHLAELNAKPASRKVAVGQVWRLYGSNSTYTVTRIAEAAKTAWLAKVGNVPFEADTGTLLDADGSPQDGRWEFVSEATEYDACRAAYKAKHVEKSSSFIPLPEPATHCGCRPGDVMYDIGGGFAGQSAAVICPTHRAELEALAAKRQKTAPDPRAAAVKAVEEAVAACPRELDREAYRWVLMNWCEEIGKPTLVGVESMIAKFTAALVAGTDCTVSDNYKRVLAARSKPKLLGRPPYSKARREH